MSHVIVSCNSMGVLKAENNTTGWVLFHAIICAIYNYIILIRLYES